MMTKSTKSLIALGSVVAGLSIFESFRKSKNNPKVQEVKNWNTWEIEFKENTTDIEKSKAIKAIQKHLIDYLYYQELSGVIIREINFSSQDLSNRRVSANAGVTLEMIAKTSPRFPPPPPPPIIPDDFSKFSTFILNIKVKVINDKFNKANSNQGVNNIM